jgi:fumarylacetoacetase
MQPDAGRGLKSFVPAGPECHFPIQNLPYCVFQPDAGAPPRVGVGIGNSVLDLALLERQGLLRDALPAASAAPLFDAASLNAFMALGRPVWRSMRERLTALLREDQALLRDDRALRAEALRPMEEVTYLLPAQIGDYTDFYSSKEHAANVGALLRGPANALLPNWVHLPVAYHGRSSSVVVSGTDLHRPLGQTRSDQEPAPCYGPSRAVDFELEVGLLIGPGNRLGAPIPIEQAEEHIFGLVLVNDWSARDVQKWEYQPLGPFLSKSFGTSISPWVVTLEALEPFRLPGPPQDPRPLPYLRGTRNMTFDLHLEVWLHAAGAPAPARVCASNLRHLYWSFVQQVAHHTSNGCNLRTGDLLATGTISGPDPMARGCLLELTSAGREPLTLPGGQTRTFLQDGDRVTMTGWCQAEGYRVGFGEVTGRLLPARE